MNGAGESKAMPACASETQGLPAVKMHTAAVTS